MACACGRCDEAFCTTITPEGIQALPPDHLEHDCLGDCNGGGEHVAAGGVIAEIVVGDQFLPLVVAESEPFTVENVIAQAEWATGMCVCGECEDIACPYLPGGSHNIHSCDKEIRSRCAACIDEQTEEYVEGYKLPRQIIVEIGPGKFQQATLDWHGDASAEAGLTKRIGPDVYRLVGEPTTIAAAAARLEEGRGDHAGT